jgi:hypothetical protein
MCVRCSTRGFCCVYVYHCTVHHELSFSHREIYFIYDYVSPTLSLALNRLDRSKHCSLYIRHHVSRLRQDANSRWSWRYYARSVMLLFWQVFTMIRGRSIFLITGQPRERRDAWSIGNFLLFLSCELTKLACRNFHMREEIIIRDITRSMVNFKIKSIFCFVLLSNCRTLWVTFT